MTDGSLFSTSTIALLILYLGCVLLAVIAWWRKQSKLQYVLLATGVGLILLSILTWLANAPIGIVPWLGLLLLALAGGYYSNKWLRVIPMPKKHAADKKEEWTALLLLLITTPPLSETLTRVLINELNSTNSVVLFSLITVTLGLTMGLSFKIYQRR